MGVYIKAKFSYDPDALAFIQASSIPQTSQKLAINQLVLDLKSYGIWSKMKAIYPMVGGSAFYHKWNLKDPRDLDAAFRLNFVGGWTHTAGGALPNGTNAYANTFLDSANNLSLNSGHMSFYSRTNLLSAAINIDMGSLKSSPDSYTDLDLSNQNNTYFRFNNTSSYNFIASTTTLGFFTGSRTTPNIIKTFRNGVLIIAGNAISLSTSSADYFIGASNNHGVGSTDTPQYYSNRECAFASIGDGLLDTEAANFYTAVQNFQIALGRSIGTQTVSDPDAQAFVNAAVIEDQIQATAINQLVIDMKAANIWTKMKAIYPFVGGTAASHKWNLKNPLDTNAAFRLSFIGGWTHTAQGVQANGTNGYADTFFVPSVQYSVDDNHHISIYSRLNQTQNDVEIGSYDGTRALQLRVFFSSGTEFYSNNLSPVFPSDTNSVGNYIGNRIGTAVKIFKNNTTLGTFTNSANGRPTFSLFLANSNNSGSPNAGLYSNKQYAFSSIGDGLTDTEAANLYTIVQNFNTTLNRQI